MEEIEKEKKDLFWFVPLFHKKMEENGEGKAEGFVCNAYITEFGNSGFYSTYLKNIFFA